MQYALRSIVPPPASMTMMPRSAWGSLSVSVPSQNTQDEIKYRIGCEATAKAKVKACFTLGHKLYPRLPVLIVRDKACKHCRTPDLTLLGAFPSIWVC